MALDVGSRRIGVAVSDELRVLASPVAVVERSSRAADLESIKALVQEYQPVELLVGLPLFPSGGSGRQARQSERFADVIRQQFSLPVRLWNERYSTLEARRRRSVRGRARAAAPADAEAAAVFLQDYLDASR